MPSNILLITMGGTINAAPYSEKEGEYPVNSTMTNDNLVLDAAKKICANHPQTNLKTIAICNKDSKNLNEHDQDNLLQTLMDTSKISYDRIIVTIGTDKMCKIAKDSQNININLTCPIIFTGSIWPLANGKHSDGWVNLKNAIFTNTNIEPDIYIAMGDIFAPANEVEKDFENKVFINTKNLTNRGA